MVGLTKKDVMEALHSGTISRPALNDAMLGAMDACLHTITLLEHGTDVQIVKNLAYHWLFRYADVLQPLLERRIALLLDIKKEAANEEAAS